jgi:predicted nucleic acid-binding protein
MTMNDDFKRIVLDANILIRAVLGKKVRGLIDKYAGHVQFYTPNVCYADALKYIPPLMKKRNLPPEKALMTLEALMNFINIIDEAFYQDYADDARQRIGMRDLDDYPVLALSLYLKCPVWTEDLDFFGAGIVTWNTQNVEIFLSSSP